MNDELFSKVVRRLNHVQHALPPPSSASQHRSHSLQLPEHSAQLSDSNFLTRRSYKKYFIYLFPEFRMQQYKQQNSRVHNTLYAYMDTKWRMCHHQ